MNAKLPQSQSDRLYYMDAMRSVLMTLGIVLHAAAIFSPNPWVVKDANSALVFEWMIDFIHFFRMPAFFVVSGFFCHMSLTRYGHRKFLTVRLTRIIVPLVVAALTLITTQNIVAATWNGRPFSFTAAFNWTDREWLSHLWFLVCLIYYFIGAAILFLIAPQLTAKISNKIASAASNNFALCLLILPFFSYITALISYRTPHLPGTAYDLDIADAIEYCTYFAFGVFLGHHKELLANFIKLRWWVVVMLCLALVFEAGDYEFSSEYLHGFVVRYIHQFIPWALCSLCFFCFYTLFSRRSAFFLYMSDASYSIYLFHHLTVVLFGIVLIPLPIPISLKFFMVIAGTAIVTTAIHHFVILRHPVMRFLFNGKTGVAEPASTLQVCQNRPSDTAMRKEDFKKVG